MGKGGKGECYWVKCDGSTSVEGDSQLNNVGMAISQAVKKELALSMRQGGALWNYKKSK